MIDHHDITRDEFMLHGPLSHHGYDWWWHSFTAQDAETGEDKPFFIEFFTCNPALAEDVPVLGQLPANQSLLRFCLSSGIASGATVSFLLIIPHFHRFVKLFLRLTKHFIVFKRKFQ